MTKKDFNQRVNEMCAYVKQHEYDDMREQLKPFVQKYGLQAVFAYANWCEYNFERNLREDYERKTTYTSDFSIAEWCVPVDGMNAIASTLRNALQNWRDNIEWFAEIIIVLSLKAHEHAVHEVIGNIPKCIQSYILTQSVCTLTGLTKTTSSTARQWSIITIMLTNMVDNILTAGEIRVILNRLFCVMMCENQMVAGLNDTKLMTFSDLASDGVKLEKSYKRCVDNFDNLRGWHTKHDKDSIRLRSEFINRLAKLV